MKIVILGKGVILGNIILGATDANADIVGVFRYEYTCSNRIIQFFKDIFNPDNELTLIKRYGFKQLKFKSANSKEFRDFLIKNNIDIVFVGTWREKLEKSTFDIPTIGTINVHPSLLPKYRGPNPYLQTILNGEEYSGATLHLVDENFDTGAILSQEKIKITPNDTSKELKEKTATVVRKLVFEFLNDLNTKIVTPISQSEKHSSYFPNITGDEKMLDFTNQTSDEISRTIRALHPYLPTYITYKNKFFITDPYHFEILNDNNEEKFIGKIISKNPKKKSLTIVCKDKKSICFNNLKLYKAKFFTELYIKYFMR